MGAAPARHVVNAGGDHYDTKQGYAHHSGISAATAGARGLCMHRVTTPPNVPHLPFNPSASEACTCIISRTDPSEQESVVLLPELERAHRPDV